MKYRLAATITVLLVLTACATTPTNRFVRVSTDAESSLNRIAKVAIVADVCLTKDVIGNNDYWIIQESRAAAGHMLDAAKTYLGGKGYEVSYAQAPFVGAFKKRETSFKVADEIGKEVREQVPPLYESDDIRNNPAYKTALLSSIIQVPVSNAGSSGFRDMKDQMHVISSNTGADATLFLIGNGVIVSTGKQLAEGLATGILTTALTLGMFTYYQYDVSYLDTFAVLVDNTTGEALWSNAMRFKGDGFTDKSYYDAEKWPKSMLYHMPAKSAHAGVLTSASDNAPKPKESVQNVSEDKDIAAVEDGEEDEESGKEQQ